jgi:predicted transcriptional regulator
MTKQEIDAVLDRVRTWPLQRQEDAIRVLLRLEEQGADTHELTAEELAEIELAEAEAERGEFASDEEMAALFDEFRRR